MRQYVARVLGPGSFDTDHDLITVELLHSQLPCFEMLYFTASLPLYYTLACAAVSLDFDIHEAPNYM